LTAANADLTDDKYVVRGRMLVFKDLFSALLLSVVLYWNFWANKDEWTNEWKCI